jgi:hypothetical protein
MGESGGGQGGETMAEASVLGGPKERDPKPDTPVSEISPPLPE